MKVDLDGIANSIKDALAGPRRNELAFMVDEMVRNLREQDAKIGRARSLINRRVEGYDGGDRPMSPPAWMLELRQILEGA